MGKKTQLKEGIFSNLVGRALLALSGAGKDYKKLKKHMNEPEFKKTWDNMESDLKQITKDFEALNKKYSNK
tara:strand:- start:3747 stop:3959 length:213 start_codon:yes stop_codon:yes gene_type:complete